MDRAAGRRGGRLLAVAGLLAAGVVLGAAGRAAGLAPLRITSTSMAPALHAGQWVLVSDVGDVERGDVVTFSYPIGTSGRAVKRVVAIGGDRVETTASSVVVNGRSMPLRGWPGEPRPPVVLVVPDGHVFLLGDNHAVSIDSRGFGAVPTSAIVAEVHRTIPSPVAIALGVGSLAAVAALVSRWLKRDGRAAGSADLEPRADRSVG